MQENYSIGELVKKLNMNKETIRYYERIGLLIEPKKDKNGYRVYGKEDIEKIQFINIVKNLGFKLREIKILMDEELLYGDLKHIKEVISKKVLEINIKLDELQEKRELLKKVDGILSSDKVPNCEEIRNIF
ncbi:MerR family transcriptional regulator, Zn(II)-responsive regulator of zntA [Clostridium cavendishii DSM 21758]|uniref:MerR family transcriptional regulator, Zn(II)-responsive regulator of zntA n=1 Tax=Clostridium cavendishii DSM 21758 TaxID=1121302 RepID=A0A1M6HK89_9CLOT|nr:MerR family transcriptional regulator [Clostridium cavendishii]SHJ22597.1 MerR family transcriptional regulator, Zn(II)-responsive regulator of zntA [Clostridium cavendishii DSM 21758]